MKSMQLSRCLLVVLALCGTSLSAQRPSPTNLKELLAFPPGSPKNHAIEAFITATPESKCRIQVEYFQLIIDRGALSSSEVAALKEIMARLTPEFYTESEDLRGVDLIALSKAKQEVDAKLYAAFPTPEKLRKVTMLFIDPLPRILNLVSALCSGALFI